MKNKKNRIQLILAFCLPLLMACSYANGQSLPAPSAPGYDAAKVAYLASLPIPPTPLSPAPAPGPAPSTSLTWADGCFINPDTTYSTLARNDDGSTGSIAYHLHLHYMVIITRLVI
jgi:hypothetical protein